MKLLNLGWRIIYKSVITLVVLLFLYFTAAIICTKITVNKNQESKTKVATIFVSTNGVHSDIIIPLELIDSIFLRNIYILPQEKYVSLGWGDRNFYINTPEWADLTVRNAVTAMFWDSRTLMHVTRFKKREEAWKEVTVSQNQFNTLIGLAFADFGTDEQAKYEMLENQSYGAFDNFYEAKGSYHCFKTCNTWTNMVLKKSGLKSAYWTPFDFGIMDKY